MDFLSNLGRSKIVLKFVFGHMIDDLKNIWTGDHMGVVATTASN